MTEIFTIDVKLTSDEKKLLEIPEIITVPRGSIVRWNIRSFEESMYRYSFSPSLIFTLYFENKSPFGWKRVFIQPDISFRHYPKIIRLAEDIADEKGDYKYGVNVFDAEQNKIIYDEDPILRVF
jgi:hypothetical protein